MPTLRGRLSFPPILCTRRGRAHLALPPIPSGTDGARFRSSRAAGWFGPLHDDWPCFTSERKRQIELHDVVVAVGHGLVDAPRVDDCRAEPRRLRELEVEAWADGEGRRVAQILVVAHRRRWRGDPPLMTQLRTK